MGIEEKIRGFVDEGIAGLLDFKDNIQVKYVFIEDGEDKFEINDEQPVKTSTYFKASYSSEISPRARMDEVLKSTRIKEVLPALLKYINEQQLIFNKKNRLVNKISTLTKYSLRKL